MSKEQVIVDFRQQLDDKTTIKPVNIIAKSLEVYADEGFVVVDVTTPMEGKGFREMYPTSLVASVRVVKLED